MSRTILLLLAVVLVSTAGLFAHRALAEATPLAIAAWRLGLASLFFLGWAAFGNPFGSLSSARRITAPAAWLRLILAGFCLALHFLTWFASLQYTLIAQATLLACTTPLWTALGNMLLKRRSITPAYGLALGLAGIGIWLVTQTGRQAHAPATLLGDGLAVTAAILFSIYLLAVEGLHATVNSRQQVTVAYSVAAAILWLTLMIHEGVRIHYSPGVWRAILGMTLGPQIFGHTLLNSSLRHFPSSTVAFSILLEPILAGLLAWALLHQAILPVQAFGGLLVLLGLGTVIAQQSPAEHQEDELVG